MTGLSQTLSMLGGTIAVPGWLVLAAAVAGAFLVAILLARAEYRDNPLTLLGVLGILVGGVVIGSVIAAEQRRAAVAAEADALSARAAALDAATAQSVAACIAADDALMSACEAVLFEKPEQVANARSLLRARLALVEDGYAFAQRREQPQFADRIAIWRLPLERDAFGLVGAMLSEVPGCTNDYCPQALYIGRTEQIAKNLQDGRYQALIAKYAPGWDRNARNRGLASQPVRTGPFGFAIVDRPGQPGANDRAPTANLPVDETPPPAPARAAPGETHAEQPAPAPVPPPRPAARSAQGATGSTRPAAQPSRPRPAAPPAAAAQPPAEPDGDGDADAQ